MGTDTNKYRLKIGYILSQYLFVSVPTIWWLNTLMRAEVYFIEILLQQLKSFYYKTLKKLNLMSTQARARPKSS